MVLDCIVLNYGVLYCNVSSFMELHCMVSDCTVLYWIRVMLYYVVAQWTPLINWTHVTIKPKV